MSLTNLCSCALMKDHKMRQIIILKNYEFGIIFLKKKYFDLFIFKNLRSRLMIWECSN